mmetsp:Transcript_33419/g.78829  ORF Transcript_33419/g.78829 Transcript_33419/m.78829 type:complete len:145 (-) Transcript_33419:377-811(-)
MHVLLHHRVGHRRLHRHKHRRGVRARSRQPALRLHGRVPLPVLRERPSSCLRDRACWILCACFLLSLPDLTCSIVQVDGFVAKSVKITRMDLENFSITAQGSGEKFQPRTKHPQGTEIKAITYSAMQILVHPDGNAELYVIVDI